MKKLKAAVEVEMQQKSKALDLMSAEALTAPWNEPTQCTLSSLWLCA